jgi:hypothetical protein
MLVISRWFYTAPNTNIDRKSTQVRRVIGSITHIGQQRADSPLGGYDPA